MNSPVIMNFYSFVSAWIRPIQPRFNLRECGCCGLRHGLAVCPAKTSTCFKCGTRGHYAGMCRTRSVGAVMTMSSTSTFTIGTQTDESARRKSERKSIRDREKMVEFRRQFKETRTELVLRNLPFSIADISVIQCETLETEVEKYKKQVTSLKKNMTFYNHVWTQEKKYSQVRATEQDKKIKQFQNELATTTDELKSLRRKYAICDATLKRKLEEVMARIDACPENSATVTEASRRLGCGHDEYGNSQYLCLPNVNLTSYVEFCYEGIMPLQENGSCLQASKRDLILASCVEFSSGCPKAHYRSSEFYKYSACQNINLKHHCYALDPSCPPNTTENANLIIPITYGGLMVLVIIAVFFVLIYHQRKKRKRMKEENGTGVVEDYEARYETINTVGGTAASPASEETTEENGLLKKLDDALNELQGLLSEERDLQLFENAVLTLNNCINTKATNNDVFINVKHVLRLGKMIIKNLKSSVLEWRATCSFLLTVFQENEFSLRSISTLPNQRNKYLEILEDRSYSKLWHSAVSVETSLLNTIDFLTNIKEDASSNLIDTLQNNINEQKIVKFLSKLQSRAEELIHKSEVKSARLASECVNIYFKIAILHSIVLWQVLCIKLRSACDESSTKGVYSMVKNCDTASLNMLKCITHPLVEHAVFLSVFHITDNENVLHFLQIQDIAPLVFDRKFFDQKHYIERVSIPCVRLHMKQMDYYIKATETTEGCEFVFEPVNGRELDNVCYIRSAHQIWETYYIQMNSKEFCVAVKNRPESGGKWKCVPLGTDKEHQTFIVSPIDSPGLFLYLNTGCARGRRDLDKVKKNGLWKICRPA